MTHIKLFVLIVTILLVLTIASYKRVNNIDGLFYGSWTLMAIWGLIEVYQLYF